MYLELIHCNNILYIKPSNIGILNLAIIKKYPTVPDNDRSTVRHQCQPLIQLMYVCCLLFHPDVFIALLSTTAFTSEEMTRFPVSRGAWPPAPPRVPGPRQIPHPTGRFSISSLRGLLLEDLCMNHRLTTFSLFINTDFLFFLYDHFLGFRNHENYFLSFSAWRLM